MFADEKGVGDGESRMHISVAPPAKKESLYKSHKRVCGRALDEITTIPTFYPPSSPIAKIPPTTGLLRHLGELSSDRNASWHAFYGSPSAPQKRVLWLPIPAHRARFEKMRDHAIETRDPESVRVVLEQLLTMVDGERVTRRGVIEQTVEDFGVNEERLMEVEMTDEGVGVVWEEGRVDEAAGERVGFEGRRAQVNE